MLSIEYSYNAVTDVENIFTSILKDKPIAANEYITKLENYIDLLKTNAQMGVRCKNRGVDFDCRVLVYDSYKIFYQNSDEIVYILRIVNSKQNSKNTKL
jgi:plasmid stabilization system protein ParE